MEQCLLGQDRDSTRRSACVERIGLSSGQCRGQVALSQKATYGTSQEPQDHRQIPSTPNSTRQTSRTHTTGSRRGRRRGLLETRSTSSSSLVGTLEEPMSLTMDFPNTRANSNSTRNSRKRLSLLLSCQCQTQRTRPTSNYPPCRQCSRTTRNSNVQWLAAQ